MENNLNISSSPHIHGPLSTRRIMLDVVISLLPAAIAGIVIFGFKALSVISVCIAVCVFSEYIFNWASKKKQTIGDLSAVVTGLILGLNLPADTALWQAGVGSVFAIIIVKCLFGGLGHNIVNPAATARVFMLVAFSSLAKPSFPLDSVSSATPLAEMKAGEEIPNLLTLFLGNYGGSIGETCTLALLIGGIYLICRKVITWHIPVSFIATVFIFSLIKGGFDFNYALAQILTGGLFLGAFFMATDYVTSPATDKGKLFCGVGAGLFTCLIRFFGVYPEGVSFAILLMNILDPYIDIWTTRKLFGGAKK